ncbi:MAG: CAP domain-containing protein [Planctomycetaceae bacterium]|jgi:uncharacterized protein YkwD
MLEGMATACLLISLAIGPDAEVIAQNSDPNSWLTQHPTIISLMELQNQERARYGLHPLRMNTDMCLAAQKHARWMAETGYYVHSGLPWPEIIHHGPRTPQGAVTGWIYSPPHHGIMLSGSEAGFGYAVQNGYTYWVTVIQ